MATKSKILRKPIKISLHYHKAKNKWFFKYIFNKAKRIERDGKIKYGFDKGDSVVEYVNDLEWYGKPNNSMERQANKETEKLLLETLADKQHEMRRGKYHLQSKDVKGRNVLDDLEDYAKSNDNNYSKQTITQHMSIHKHLKTFTNSDTFSYNDITTEFCSEYLSYLKSDGIGRMGKNLAESSIANYLNKFKVFLGVAHKKGYLVEYPATDVKVKKPKNSRKETLDSKELQKLINTSCANPEFRRFFLFSCFSGQAFAECLKMEWSDVYKAEDVTRIRGTRLKTNSDYVVPLNTEAKYYLGSLERRQPNHKVFSKLTYSGNNNRHLIEWVRKAGIDKHITPHCARHTFTRNYWENGNKDIIALMQILDHKDVSTTQRYLSSVIGSQYSTPPPSLGDFNIE
tara:strand:+ start:103 stop:1302 length:1200 start_codon:yes stop_codon:yes gene_type:complete